MSIDCTLATACSDYTEDDLTQHTNRLIVATGVSWTSTYVCGSVVITSIVSGLSSVQRDSATATLDTALSSPSAASDFFNTTVTSVSYEVETFVAAPPSAPPSSAGMIGGIVGGLCGCLSGVFGGYMLYKRGKGNVSPA